MTPPSFPQYHLGRFLVTDRNENGRHDPESDILDYDYLDADKGFAIPDQRTVLSDANKYFAKFGMVLRYGHDLRQFALQTNLHHAEAAAETGDIVETRLGIERAAAAAEQVGLGDFHAVQRERILMRGVERFLALGGPTAERLASEGIASDFEALRTGTERLPATRVERSAFRKLVQKTHRKSLSGRWREAEAGVASCNLASARDAMGELFVHSAAARVPLNAARLQRLLNALSRCTGAPATSPSPQVEVRPRLAAAE